MRSSFRYLPLLCLLAALGTAPVRASCEVSFKISQGPGGGNLFTDAGRAYGGWFWMAGAGNNLLSEGSGEGNIGNDSGRLGGVPLDPTPFGTSWLVDFLQDGSTRMVEWDWNSAGSDGCGDLNRSNTADSGEVLAVLVVDSVGQEYAMLSVAGTGFDVWDLSGINNGVTSAAGTPGNGIPMTAIPEPRFGEVRQTAGGNVEVEVLLPSAREIPTYDEVGGGRQMVQGFHVLSGDQLLAEALLGTPKVSVKARPGDRLVLRTVFGAPGDAGFFVDGLGTVPAVGSPAERRPEPGQDREPPESAPEPPPAAAASGVVAGNASEQQAENPDLDGDEILNDEDNCPEVGNPEQEDSDADGIGDFCDLCPFEADEEQADADGDGLGDACDTCPQDPENLDGDGDGACDRDDNCPEAPNADQADGDGDGTGDSCDETFDPFVVEVEPASAKALAGGSVALTFAVNNRAATTRSLELWVEVVDAKKEATRVAEGPGCLKKVPLTRSLPPGEGLEMECTVPVPEAAARGKGAIRIVAQDKESPEHPGEATVKLTIQ